MDVEFDAQRLTTYWRSVAVRGPYERLKYEFRRTFECPVCHTQRRAPGTVTSQLCSCQAKQPPEDTQWMRMISEGDSGPRSASSSPASASSSPASSSPAATESESGEGASTTAEAAHASGSDDDATKAAEESAPEAEDPIA